MNRSALAARLIQARTSSQRRRILAANVKLADVGLARALKDFCYRVWTSEPAKTRQAAAAIQSLQEFSDDKEAVALASWVEGIADITAGKLESAVSSLDSASRRLSRLGNEHESAQPLVAKLIALAMLGRYETAQKTGEQALRIFRKFGDQLAAGKIEMNLSNIVSRRDQYRAAEQYCLSAYRRFKKLGEKSWQTMAENGLANTYAELNDFKRAEEFYDRALKTAKAARMHVTIAEIEASMGNLALFRGAYAEAIRRLEISRQKYEKLAMPHQTVVAELEIADIYAELNLNAEAIAIYQRIIPVLRRLKMRAEEARARANFGRALATTENPQAARRELKQSAKLFDQEKNSVASSAALVRLASLELSQEKYDEALATLAKASPAAEEGENVRLRLSALWLRGEILLKLRQFPEAERLLDRALKAARRNEQAAIVQASLNSLGVLARQSGDLERAEAMFEAAIKAAEASRAPLPGEEFRMAFLAKSLEPFENLTSIYLAQGEIEKAFASVERARSRALLESLATQPNTKKSDESTKLRQELNRLYSLAARGDESHTAKLQRQIRDRERQLDSISLRLQSAAGTRHQDGPAGLDIGAVQKQLGSDCALIEFVEQGGQFSAFVVTRDRIRFVNDIASETEILSLLEGLHFQFGAYRFGVNALASFADELKARTNAYLQKLFDKLIKPLEAHIGASDLVVVPAKSINYVPLHALLDGAQYLIESRKVTYAPSAGVWLKLKSRRGRKANNALLMAYADEKIPLVNDEVSRLARLLPNAKKCAGNQATFAAFQQNAPAFDLIHLACHGQFRPDSPMFSSLHLADGWVTVRDVCASRLKAELVTLSACETGVSKVFPGDEILGLARGFLSAGAKSLILSLWTVSDAATAELMEQIYTNLQRGSGVAASLNIAQNAFIRRGEHPYYWSPFFVIG